jgi:hypothetical protein
MSGDSPVIENLTSPAAWVLIKIRVRFMKLVYILCFLVLLAVLMLPACAVPDSLAPVQTEEHTITQPEEIRTGIFFGMCGGYCQTELRITSSEMISIKKSNLPGDTIYPEITHTHPIPAGTWDRLVAAAGSDQFDNLPAVIGCPDCADGGGEWIEITRAGTTKRVELEYAASVPEIADLLQQLRALREEIVSLEDG